MFKGNKKIKKTTYDKNLRTITENLFQIKFNWTALIHTSLVQKVTEHFQLRCNVASCWRAVGSTALIIISFY